MTGAVERLYQLQYRKLSFFQKITKYLSANFIDGSTIDKYVKDVFDGKIKKGDIDEALFNETYKNLSQAVDKGFGTVKYNEPDYEFNQELKSNTAVFSAFKNHAETIEMVDALTDENGKILSFNEYKKATKKITGKYEERWLEAEYDIAVKSSRSAKKWKELERTKHLYPNIEYVRSRSAEPRDEHKQYYGLIKPIDDPIWDSILPPNGWGCNCDWRKTRKDADEKEYEPIKTIPGIVGNAGKSGQIFSTKHPIVKNTSKEANANIKKQLDVLERKFIRRTAISYCKKNYSGKAFYNKTIKKDISVTTSGIKEIGNQSHKYNNAKNALLFDIDIVIKRAKWIKKVDFDKTKKGHREFEFTHYFEIKLKKETSYLVVHEKYADRGFVLYSIVDKLRTKK